MAKSSLQPPPSPSSESEEEDGSSSDEEQQHANKKPPPQAPIKNKKEDEDEESEDESDEESNDEEEEDGKPQLTASTPSKVPSESKSGSESGSGSESEEESESESDSDSEAAKLVVPISSRPMAEAQAEKSANGKALFQRIWTLDDEITVLRSLVQFQSEKGPVELKPALIKDFHDFVRKNLSLEVTNTQLVDKLRRLKKKYGGVAARAESGKPLKLASAHDKTVYDLGKKIWVEDGESERKAISIPPTVKGDSGALDPNMRFPLLKGAVKDMGKAKRYAEEALKTLDPTKADALEKRLKKQKIAEMKLHAAEMDLYKETFKLIMEGIDMAPG